MKKKEGSKAGSKKDVAPATLLTPTSFWFTSRERLYGIGLCISEDSAEDIPADIVPVRYSFDPHHIEQSAVLLGLATLIYSFPRLKPSIPSTGIKSGKNHLKK